MKYYNWDLNILKIDNKVCRINFNFNRRDLTIVTGDSGTGKTYITEFLNEAMGADSYLDDGRTEGIFILDRKNKISFINGDVKHCLVIIDRGDIFLGDKGILDAINRDYGNNRYLIFMRKSVDIRATPNNIAEVVNNNGTLELYYKYNVEGWF